MFLSRFGVCRRLEGHWQTPSLPLLLYRRNQKRIGPLDIRSPSGPLRASEKAVATTRFSCVQVLTYLPSVRNVGERRNPIAPLSVGTSNPTRTLCRCADIKNPVGLLTCRNIDGLSANVPVGFRREVRRRGEMTKRSIATGGVAAVLILALAGCTNPYDPAQRAVGGGLLGAGAGAAIGGAVGGGHGAALGAAIGGATGALGGAATTPVPPPPPPPQGYYGPPGGYSQAAPGYGPPPGYGQPAPGYGYPPPGHGQPAPGYGYPPPSY